MSQAAERQWSYYLFALPALLLSACVILVPALLTLILAFTDWDGVSRPVWLGLGVASLEELFADIPAGVRLQRPRALSHPLA